MIELPKLRWPWKRVRILLLTAHDQAFQPFAALTIPRMQQYADCHKYELRVIKDVTCGRPGSWMKVGPICRAPSEHFDFVWWVDVDALILRYDVDIRSVIVPSSDLQMSWLSPETTEWNGPPTLVGHFNAGVMLIRVGAWSRKFFERVWDYGEINGHSWWEQATMLHLLGYDNLIGIGHEDENNDDRQHVTRLDPSCNSVPGVATTPEANEAIETHAD